VIPIRLALAADVEAISVVRHAVRENMASREELAARGITPASVAASFSADSRGWVAEAAGRIVGFSIADRADASIFALFVLPEFEGRGLGTKLLDLAVAWLRDEGAGDIWLVTGEGTRAAGFYAARGWRPAGRDAAGDLRFELAGSDR
jgi:GNAT superfamily N-acetyltransferase